jgi:membrane protein implicated in regulation of membrane protease activity
MIGWLNRLIRWGWSAWLVYIGLMALFLLGLLLSDGAWWALPLFAFFAFVAYVQIRNRRRRYDRS